MSSPRTWSSPALVLKRTKTGESDTIVTLLTPEQGKVIAVAKGVRKLTSSKASVLEPGHLVEIFCATTQSLPIITQAKLTIGAGAARTHFPKTKQLFQFLEIIDSLFVEGVGDEALFAQLVGLHTDITAQAATPATVRTRLENIVAQLGYQHPQETQYPTLLEYVSVLADRPLRSWQYLSLPT
jgi:DNA repair protein RecO